MFPQKLFELLKVSRGVARFEKEEKQRVQRLFFDDAPFFKVDRALNRAYAWQNPYRLSRHYWGEHVYGETPLSSLEIIGRRAQLKKSDCFVDLGSGRGRGVFFTHYRFGCRAVGIERVPAFVEKAEKVQKKLGVSGVEFIQDDLSRLSSIQGTVFYLAWTCFQEPLTRQIVQWLDQLPSASRVITVSEPIESDRFSLVDQFNVPFAWGEGEIFLHEKQASV